MQHSSSKSLLATFKNAFVKILTFTVLALFAFQANAGGDSYEIYLNNKLILKQHVMQPLNIKNLQLDKLNSGDQLVIFYSHCGQTGKGRSIAIKDDAGKILKEWKFANAADSHESMVIPAKELLQLAKDYTKTHLTLFYSAQELPKGRMLASLALGKGNVTFNSPKAEPGNMWTTALVGILFLKWFLV